MTGKRTEKVDDAERSVLAEFRTRKVEERYRAELREIGWTVVGFGLGIVYTSYRGVKA